MQQCNISFKIFCGRENNVYLCSVQYKKGNWDMSQIEYVTIKNASRKVLKKMRQIGEEKAQRLQSIQERWEAGDYKDAEVVQLW